MNVNNEFIFLGSALSLCLEMENLKLICVIFQDVKLHFSTKIIYNYFNILKIFSEDDLLP